MQVLHRELAAAQAALAAAGAAAATQASQDAAAPLHAQPSAPPPVPAMPPPPAVPVVAADGSLPTQAPMCAEACRAAAVLGELQRRLARTHGRLLSRDASARKYKARAHMLCPEAHAHGVVVSVCDPCMARCTWAPHLGWLAFPRFAHPAETLQKVLSHWGTAQVALLGNYRDKG